jgi:hypothetical protein
LVARSLDWLRFSACLARAGLDPLHPKFHNPSS